MKKVVFGPILLALALFVAFLSIPNSWLASLISDEKVNYAATDLNPLMLQGAYIQEQMLKDDKYLPIYGSSELSRQDQFHPANYFKVTNEAFTPFLVGRGGTSSLFHFLNFSIHADKLKDKKIVFVLSPQWFVREGTDETHFSPNFSMLQGYLFALHNKIDPQLRKKALKRLLTFETVQNDKMLTSLYKAELKEEDGQNWKATLIKPVAKVYKSMLEKKDLYYSLVRMETNRQKIDPNLNGKSMDELKELAAQMGKERSGSNEFGIDDRYYKWMIEEKLTKLKNYRKGQNYTESVEYEDFQMVLDLLKESGAKPLFISVPVNGPWYDYTGFTKKDRADYYKKIKNQIEVAGFPIVDFSDHEYDPFFMKDTIHLGWKGWVYVDEALKEFMNSSN